MLDNKMNELVNFLNDNYIYAVNGIDFEKINSLEEFEQLIFKAVSNYYKNSWDIEASYIDNPEDYTFKFYGISYYQELRFKVFKNGSTEVFDTFEIDPDDLDAIFL